VPFEITMPQLGLTMESGHLVEWLVKEGERFDAGQEILEVETDKALVSVEARQPGKLARVLVHEGAEEVPVGAPLAVATLPGEELPEDWQPEGAAPPPENAPPPRESIPERPTESGPAPAGSLNASWKARRLAREGDLDLDSLTGSGPEGRIVAADVLAALEGAPETEAAEAAPRVSPVAARLSRTLGIDPATVPGSGPGGRVMQADVLERAATLLRERETASPPPSAGPPQVAEREPLRGVRKLVSEGMAESARTTARVTLFREVDASGLVALRERFKAQGLEVGYNDLLIRVIAVALREHPEANARLGEGQIERLDRVNVGLAVDTERGLLVPVVRNADRLTIPEIAAERARLVEAARSGRSAPDDLAGGTFTLTNLGMYGVEGFTPVLNLPESGILGVGRILRKPVVCDADDTVAVRPTLTLSLVFDHRVIDGAPAARFLDRLACLIQDPLLLLTVH
jgi:pyruvate dehydrogenase E2 component (dihydrolipoamide acetyltransferase)